VSTVSGLGPQLRSAINELLKVDERLEMYLRCCIRLPMSCKQHPTTSAWDATLWKAFVYRELEASFEQFKPSVSALFFNVAIGTDARARTGVCSAIGAPYDR
jgi:hypothetical protein